MGGQEHMGDIPTVDAVLEQEAATAAELFAYGEELKESLTSEEVAAIIAGLQD